MRKGYNKILAAALALALTGSLIGCSGKTAETQTDTGSTPQQTEGTKEADSAAETAAEALGITVPLAEPVTMSMFAVFAGYTGAELPDVLAFQVAEENTNVKWEVTSCLPADLDDKRGLLLSS